MSTISCYIIIFSTTTFNTYTDILIFKIYIFRREIMYLDRNQIQKMYKKYYKKYINIRKTSG